MVYDVSSNFVGDMHWRDSGLVQVGHELQLDRGVLVQIGEEIERKEQDLSELLDRKTVSGGKAPPPPSFPRQRQFRQYQLLQSPVLPSAARISHKEPKSLNAILEFTTFYSGRGSLNLEDPLPERHRILATGRKTPELSKRHRLAHRNYSKSDIQFSATQERKKQNPTLTAIGSAPTELSIDTIGEENGQRSSLSTLDPQIQISCNQSGDDPTHRHAGDERGNQLLRLGRRGKHQDSEAAPHRRSRHMVSSAQAEDARPLNTTVRRFPQMLVSAKAKRRKLICEDIGEKGTCVGSGALSSLLESMKYGHSATHKASRGSLDMLSSYNNLDPHGQPFGEITYSKHKDYLPQATENKILTASTHSNLVEDSNAYYGSPLLQVRGSYGENKGGKAKRLIPTSIIHEPNVARLATNTHSQGSHTSITTNVSRASEMQSLHSGSEALQQTSEESFNETLRKPELYLKTSRKSRSDMTASTQITIHDGLNDGPWSEEAFDLFGWRPGELKGTGALAKTIDIR